jgi:hypothetical protein
MVWWPALSKGCRPPTILHSAMRTPLEGFSSMERRNADRSLVTEQRVRVAGPVVPFTEDGAQALGHRYWREVAGASRGLVRCRETSDRVELSALGRGPVLLWFSGAEVAVGADAVSCTFRIRGGLLSLGERGTLVVSQTGRKEPELRVSVDGFLARLGGGILYGVQRRAHLAVSQRYFRHLLADLPP